MSATLGSIRQRWGAALAFAAIATVAAVWLARSQGAREAFAATPEGELRKVSVTGAERKALRVAEAPLRVTLVDANGSSADATISKHASASQLGEDGSDAPSGVAEESAWRASIESGARFRGLADLHFLPPLSLDQSADYFVYHLAWLLDVRTPRHELVELELAGAPAGVHLMLEDPGAATGDAPPDGRAPSAGESGGGGEAAALEGLRAAISAGKGVEATPDSLRRWVDTEAFARLEAVRLLSGAMGLGGELACTLDYDVWRDEFRPLIADARTLRASEGRALAEEVVRLLLLDPEFVRRRDAAAASLFGKGLHERFGRHVRRTLARMRPAIARDKELSYGGGETSLAEIADAHRALESRVDSMAPSDGAAIEARGVRLDPLDRKTLVFSGELVLDGDEPIEIADDVRFAAGTRVRLGPGVEVRFTGRVVAEGTREEPVHFLPAEEGRPWGRIVLAGRGTDGSRLAWCEVADGGEGAGSTGMVSIEGGRAIAIERSVFRTSRPVDALLAARGAELDLEGCAFVKAPADGLVLDECHARLADCSFFSATGRALRADRSVAVIRNGWIEKCLGGGVDFASDSRAFLHNTAILACGEAVRAADDSYASVCQCDIVGSQLAVRAGSTGAGAGAGGRVCLYKCHFKANRTFGAADAGSQILLHDCHLGRLFAATDRIFIDATSSTSGEKRATQAAAFRFPIDADSSPVCIDEAWTAVDPSLRGVNTP